MRLGEHLASLGFEPVGFALWLIDAFVVLVLASVLAASLGDRKGGAARTFLALGTLALALVTLTALGLGVAGQLHPAGFLIVHVTLLLTGPFVVAGGTWRCRVRKLATLGAQPLGEVERGLVRLLGPSATYPVRLLAVVIVGVLALSAVIAALSPPLNGDTLAYRLPRITWWLQESHLGHIEAFEHGDARVNYMPFGPDLIMLWVVGFFSHGFPLVELPQLVGGILAGAAVYRLALDLILPRWLALTSVVVFFGMPNVCVQLLTAQTDLYTAGCAAAFLVFVFAATRSGRPADFVLAGVALGLSVGAKGTVFYWAPGLLLLIAVFTVHVRTPPLAAVRGLLVAALVALPLGGATYLLNYLRYGNPFSPPATMGIVHVQPTSSRLYFAVVNGLGYGLQLLLPSSNPPSVRQPLAGVFDAGARRILQLGAEAPPFDGFAELFDGNIRSMRDLMWNEDNLSMGVLAALLAAIGGFRALAGVVRGRPRDDWLAAAWLGSVGAFFATFCLLQGWSPHKHRYFVLVAPLLAVLAARAVAAPGERPRPFAQTLGIAVAGIHFVMAALVPLANPHNGLPSLRESPRAAQLRQEEATALLGALGHAPRVVCLGPMAGNGPIGHFLRGEVHHQLAFVSMGQLREAGSVETLLNASGCGALIMQADLLDVPLGKASLHFAGTRRVMSIARPTPPDRGPEAVCVDYWGLKPNGWTRRRAMVRFDNWRRPTLPLSLGNPTPLERTVTLSTSATEITLTLAPGESRDDLRLPVASRDRLDLSVTPLYYPPNLRGRALGIELGLPASLVCREAPRP